MAHRHRLPRRRDGAIQRYAAGSSRLSGEEARLLAITLRDYRRAGLDLPKEARAQVEQWRTRLDSLSTDFRNNITRAVSPVKFTRQELEGVPDNFLRQVKTGEDVYTVMANVTVRTPSWTGERAARETRRRLEVARANLARYENVPLIEEMLILRHRIAKALGYATWADYATGVNMAKDGRTAVDFLQQLNAALRPTFVAQIEAFLGTEGSRDRGRERGHRHVGLASMYASLLRGSGTHVDTEQLRVFFPYQRVLDGMFSIYQSIFGLKFERVDPPFTWDSEVELYAVSDAQTGEPLGLFYLDMFPREGKFNHFAHFRLIAGKLLTGGQYQRPTVALICNFPSPSKDKPSLLSHGDVETIFHEFGHAMHSMMTRAKYGRFSGTSVARDFVEAPSQMLENWVWDKKVLDGFAADYRDPSKKIPADILAKLKEAKLATRGDALSAPALLRPDGHGLHTQIHDSNAAEALPPRISSRRRVPAHGAGHGLRGLLRAPDGLRRRLLRLCVGRRDCRGHGDGLRTVAPTATSTRPPAAGCVWRSTSQATPAT